MNRACGNKRPYCWPMLVMALVLLAFGANAQTSDRNAADVAVGERAKDAVVKELLASGTLDPAIGAGIEQFVERQRGEAAQRERTTKAMRPVSETRDHIRGNPAAPVTMVEYADFECPFCKSFHATLKRIVNESSGQVRSVYRHFPIDQLHSKARMEAAASECAAELGGNDVFWRFADRFFELTPSNNRTDDAVVPKIAHEIGLDGARFASCLTSGRHDARVQEDQQNAVDTGGNGTPWSIVVTGSGKMYPLSGAQPYSSVKQLIDLALRAK